MDTVSRGLRHSIGCSRALSRGTANTQIFYHHQRLLAMKEDSPPVALDPAAEDPKEIAVAAKTADKLINARKAAEIVALAEGTPATPDTPATTTTPPKPATPPKPEQSPKPETEGDG